MAEKLNQSIMIIAGEASGDLHGASLIRELKKNDSSLKFFGIGGDKMEAEGMQIIYHINKMSFLGFVEVVRHLPFIKEVQKKLIDESIKRKVSKVILIDYPGFNLNIAKKLNKLSNKPELIYYIAPQIWAWGKGRIKKIKKFISKMLVVFPFEEKLYRDNGVDSAFVGHPLIQEIKNYKFLSKQELSERLKLELDKDILILLPGSRKHEVEDIFPEAITAASNLASEFNLQVVVACSTGIEESYFSDLTTETNFKVVKNYTYDLLKHSKFGIIKSGTSTLEAGLIGLPMIIVYKANKLTYLIGKSLVKLKNIGMANILLGESVLPELIQSDVNKNKIYSESKNILSDNSKYAEIKEKLSELWNILGEKNAPENAAKLICGSANEFQKI